MFRRRLTDKMNSPESLDKLLVVVTPRAELTFTALALILLVGLVWSFIARIPMTVSGEGILLKPGSIKAVQSFGSGPITEIFFAAGDHVSAGEVLAQINQPEINRRLERLIFDYRSEKDFAETTLALAKREHDLEMSLIADSEANAKSGLEAVRELRDDLLAQKEHFATAQESSLTHMRELLDQLKKSQQGRLKSVAQLVAEGHATKTQEVSVLREVTDTANRISDLEVQIVQQNVLRVDTIQQALNLRQQFEQLRTELTQLKVRREQNTRRFETTRQDIRQRLANLEADIRSTQQTRAREGRVISFFSGTILEVNMNFGELVSSGSRLAMLQAAPQLPFFRIETMHEAGQGSLAISVNGVTTERLPFDAAPAAWADAIGALPTVKGRFTVEAKGQLPKVPMDLYLTPTSDSLVNEELIVEVLDMDLYTPSGIPAYATVVTLGDNIPEEDLKHLGFFPIGAGKKVAPGMEIRIDPANIETQRFGSLVGRVTDVSKYPMSSEGIVTLVGNSELAKAFTAQGGAIMIAASLDLDPSTPNGFKWTSKSPDVQITAGTTTTSRVTVERRRPISFAIPLLREWLLGEGKPKPTADEILQ